MTARDVIAEMRDVLQRAVDALSTKEHVSLAVEVNRLKYRLESTLAQPSGEAVAWLSTFYARAYKDGHQATVDGGYVDVSARDAATYWQDEVNEWVAEHPTTPPAPLGGLTELEREALQRLESRLTNGDFYSDYDNDWALVGKLREVIRRLTAPPAEGVDDAMVDRACMAAWPFWEIAECYSDESRADMRRTMRRSLEAALTAAAPKVGAPQGGDDLDADGLPRVTAEEWYECADKSPQRSEREE